MTDLGKDKTAGANEPQPTGPAEERKVTLLDTPITKENVGTAALALRVTEARVEDVGHGVARLAPSDLRRIGAQTGDVLKITGGTVAVGRAELSDDAHEG